MDLMSRHAILANEQKTPGIRNYFAVLFDSSPPIAKFLVKDTPPVALAGLLYLGAFTGLSLYSITTSGLGLEAKENINLKKVDLPWLFGAILPGGIVAPIFLMVGLMLRIKGSVHPRKICSSILKPTPYLQTLELQWDILSAKDPFHGVALKGI